MVTRLNVIGSRRYLIMTIFLVELYFSVPVNGYGHVGTLPPFYGTFTQT